MKMLACVLLLALGCLLLPAPAAVAECEELEASGGYGWRPYLMLRPDGEVYGVFVDVLKYAAAEMNLEVKFINVPWKRGLEMARRGKLDVITGIYKNQQRTEVFDFSVPLASDEIRIFIKKGHLDDIHSLQDLVGKKGDKPLGSSYGEAFDSFAAKYLTLNEIRGKEPALRKLLLGRSDYYISSYADGMLSLKELGLQGQIVPLIFVVVQNDVYFALSRNSACAHRNDELKAILKQMKESGRIGDMLHKYTQ